MTTTDTVAMRPLLFADDLQFWYETLRWLGLSAYGGADFGEVVTTAQRITVGDYGSWYEQWAATAARVGAEARAQQAAAHGSPRTKRGPARSRRHGFRTVPAGVPGRAVLPACPLCPAPGFSGEVAGS